MSDAEHRREPKYLLRPFEAYVLPRMAAVLPRRVMPDHMTALGAVSAAAIGLCYALSGRSANYLWAANLLWVVNWIGDSLDGTLARVRRIERPRYGYYLDHTVDMFCVAFVCLGLGFSPYLLLSVALMMLIAYYLMSINVYLETYVLGTFQFGYDYIGPTEARVILIVAGSALALGFEPVIELRNVPFGTLDFIALVGVTAMLLVLLRRIARNLADLAKLEPPNVVRESAPIGGDRSG
ncbi:MAG: CDP-alcohol phosphatidyltransferase family protein [Gemmatimonadota bacterium]|nr:MAG: CDP-alcohol phosphatidyltransferase family protein [Gemmatimonadota bacterium]